LVGQARAAQPCCDITSIDTRTGVVTAREKASGQTFQFAASPALLRTLRLGQGVYANLRARQVSIDGRSACCNIVNIGPAGNTPPSSFGNSRAPAQIAPAGGNASGAQVAPVRGVRGGTQISPPNDVKAAGSQAIPPEGSRVIGNQVSPPNNAKAGPNQVIPPNDVKAAGSQVIPPEGSRVIGNQVSPPNDAKAGPNQIIPPNGRIVGRDQITPPNNLRAEAPGRGSWSGPGFLPQNVSGAITNISGTSVRAQVDNSSGQIQFIPPSSLAPHLLLGQKVWISPANNNILVLSFPMTLQYAEKVGGGHHMATTVVVSNTGRIDGTTKTWSTEALRGFTGGVSVFLLDDQNNILYGTPMHKYGVNGASMGGSQRTDLWMEPVAQDILAKTRHIKIVQLEKPTGRWDDFIAKAKDVTDLAQAWVGMYSQVAGGGTGGTGGTGTGGTTEPTGTTSVPMALQSDYQKGTPGKIGVKGDAPQLREGKAPDSESGGGTSTQQASMPPCTQHHPGREHRIEAVAKAGDAHMAMSAAGHATRYAIQRFHLENFYLDIDHAQREVYEFLKWKMGNPAAIAAQFIAAGYQHFDRAYSDEAAAALLGTDLPSEQNGAQMTLSSNFTAKLKEEIDKDLGPGASFGGIEEEIILGYGAPEPIAYQIATALAVYKAGQMPRVGFNMPKSWDIDNRLVEAMIAARTTPSTAAQLGTAAPRALRKSK